MRVSAQVGLRAACVTSCFAVFCICAVSGCAWFGAGGGGSIRPEATGGRELTTNESRTLQMNEGRLRSTDADARRQAAVALLSMHHPKARHAVLATLQDAPRGDVRISMIRAIAFCRAHDCFAAVLDAVGGADADVRSEAASALAGFTQVDEVAAVVAKIDDDETTAGERRLLYEALGNGLAVQAVPSLMQGLQEDDAVVRAAAVAALEKISGERFGADTARWQRWWEVNAERTREDVLQQRLLSMKAETAAMTQRIGRLEEQQRRLVALAKLPVNGDVTPLLEALRGEYDVVREYASFRLAGLDPEKIAKLKLVAVDYEALAAAMDDEDPHIRLNALTFVVPREGPAREDIVRRALADEDAGVLLAAVKAVQAETGAAPRLAELLTRSVHDVVREWSANMLGKVGDQNSVPVLRTALTDKAENVRWFAIEGLRKLAAVEAVPDIAERLGNDPREPVREVAASTLGALAEPAAVPALRKALDDESERVREKAIVALLALPLEDMDLIGGIADELVVRKLWEPARGLLQRLITKCADVPERRDRLIATRGKLAAMLETTKEYAAAAAQYEALDDLTPGQKAVRKKLIASWLNASEPARAVAAGEKWLAADDAGRPDWDAALDAVTELIAAKHVREARVLLDKTVAKLGEAVPEDMQKRVDELRELLK
jgi:HEAT repeat protein